MNAQQQKRMERATETVDEYLVDLGIGLFVLVCDATQPNHLFIIYHPGLENAEFGNVPDVHETLKAWLGGSIGVHEADNSRVLRIPLALILNKRKAVQ